MAEPLRAGDPEQLGGYRLLGRLGEGGMGSVFLGEPAEGGPKVAVKVIRADLVREPEFRRRFRREVTRAQQVPPFCTAEVLYADPDHDTPYLVAEYVNGPALSTVIAEHGKLSAANLHGLALGVATALTAIHGAGIIHRDLKPGNVLLAPGSPKVIDFGIARGMDLTQSLTRPDQVIGSVSYMAPERFENGPLTQATDVFAWGAVVAYAGTGRLPFTSDSMPATVAKILTQEPDLGELSGPIRDLVAEALAKDPEDRPTARELVDRLLAGGGPPRAMKVPAADAGARPAAITPAIADDEPTRVKGSAQPAPTTVAPAPAPETTVVKTGGSRMRGVLTGAMVLALLLTTGTVAGLLTGVIKVPSNSSGNAGTSNTPTPKATLPELAPGVPGDSEEIISDPLAAEGKWTAVNLPERPPVKPGGEKWESSCYFENSQLVAEAEQPDTYRCKGPDGGTVQNFGSYVDVTLLEPGSCAGIWFRFNGSAGYALRVCEKKLQIVEHSTGITIFRDWPLATPVTVGTPVRIGVVMVKDKVTIYRDGKPAQSANLNAGYVVGRVNLGVFPMYKPGDPVESSKVSFRNIQVWEIHTVS
ncbi:serine/threonine protein kinase [Longispora albida]|uniref:serine/threonine protein kinase n=1 Tax=Longispora albida TaxID=203523 RepID=UPI00036A1DB0|nr:serine/threonine-protein kinase [Longispora albida]